MKRGQKFTPINVPSVKELCNQYGLVEGHVDMEHGIIGEDSSAKAIVCYGIDESYAGPLCCPTVVIYEDGFVELFEDPYIAANWNEDGTVYDYYMEPGFRLHYIHSMERFEKYLVMAIAAFHRTKTELDGKNAELNSDKKNSRV